jgi:hypothetical protein
MMMTDFDATGFVRGIQTVRSAAEVDAAFGAITALKGAAKKQAIDAVELICVNEWQLSAGVGIPQMKGVFAQLEATKGTARGAFMLAQLDSMMGGPEEGKVMAAAFTNIHKIKGEKSAPLVRAYVQEIAKMPAEEFNTTLGQLKLVMNVDAACKEGVPHKGPRPPRRRSAKP